MAAHREPQICLEPRISIRMNSHSINYHHQAPHQPRQFIEQQRGKTACCNLHSPAKDAFGCALSHSIPYRVMCTYGEVYAVWQNCNRQPNQYKKLKKLYNRCDKPTRCANATHDPALDPQFPSTRGGPGEGCRDSGSSVGTIARIEEVGSCSPRERG